MAIDRNSRDLAITPGRFALVLDRTKGYVETLTGPFKSSLADTQTPVKPEPGSETGYREFEPPFAGAIMPYVVARQGQYVRLYNPAKDGVEKPHPEEGKGLQPPVLEIGNVINIPGPVTFALWWQQLTEVIDGHQLKSNQYLLVEVTNEKQARENWKKAVVLEVAGAEVKANSIKALDPSKFTMGQRIIIQGNEISFFIPPTGMRVVQEGSNGTSKFIREAVTLESQQYCVLLGENGKKRYVPGPDVVFPTATENFVEDKEGSRVFKCIELNPNSGIHVMVIADYDEPMPSDAPAAPGEELPATRTIKAGTELFITGATTPIYFPRPEHAIIKYDGESFIHYATAVPEGEGRYVLDKTNGANAGRVELKAGPAMLLLNPINNIFIRRVLTQKEANLYFPGNTEVAEQNAEMAAQLQSHGEDYLASTSNVMAFTSSQSAFRGGTLAAPSVSRKLASDEVRRKSTYTPPRSLVLETKYQGAIPIAIWPGYAVQVCKTNGDARVEVGPKKVLLQYDETLTRMALSMGKPKTTDHLFETVYLRLAGNQVTDILGGRASDPSRSVLETSDGVSVEVKYILQIEFVGDNEKWFDVDNYVKMVCDHVRSIIRGAVREKTIIEFMRNAVVIIRDAILGKKDEKGKRAGLSFRNNCHIYDVEVMNVTIVDQEVSGMLVKAQKDLVQGMVTVITKQQSLTVTKEVESAQRAILTEQQLTAADQHKVKIDEARRRLEIEMANVKLTADVEQGRLTAEAAVSEIKDAISKADLAREKEVADQRVAIDTAETELEIRAIEAQTKAVEGRLKAVDAKLIAAIQASDDRNALVEVAEKMGIAAYLKNDSIGAMLNSILAGTPLADTFKKLRGAVTEVAGAGAPKKDRPGSGVA